MADLQTQITALQATQTAMQADYNESLDTIWMLLAGLLVFFMHAGFSLLEAGCVRFKNTQNILSKNLLVVTIGFLCWWATGWSFAYGAIEDPGKFIGSTQFFMDGFWDDKTTFRNWFFQGAFCATAGTIVSGAMAECTQLKGLGIYAILLTAFISIQRLPIGDGVASDSSITQMMMVKMFQHSVHGTGTLQAAALYT